MCRYDVDVPHKYGIAYATQGKSPKGMGNWPVRYKAIPCPVRDHKMEYSLVQYNNDANRFSRKIMIAGQRTPISAVEVLCVKISILGSLGSLRIFQSSAIVLKLE